MSAILSFLGGSAFRAIWHEFSVWMSRRQEHKFEIERLKVQAEMEAASHARQQEAIRLQAELGVKTIEVQRDAALSQAEADAFTAAIKAAAQPTGIRWVDAWNASVRPAFATVVIAMWVLALWQRNWVLAAWDLELSASIAGFYFADRTLGRRRT